MPSMETFFGSHKRALTTFSTAAVLGGLISWPIIENASVSLRNEHAPSTPIFVNLPDWDCNQENLVGVVDRGVIGYTRPQTSITEEQIAVSYPAIDGEDRVHQTIVYENPGLQSGQVIRYFSDSRDCPLPDGASTIPTS